MNASIAIRVTSVWQNDQKLSVFAGVPLTTDLRIQTARQIVVVKSKPELLPMMPVTGQHWQVFGPIEEHQSERNGVLITELHVCPSRCQVTLPNDGEQFIKFIAAEPAFKGIGEVKARELWHMFGQPIYDILAHEQNQ